MMVALDRAAVHDVVVCHGSLDLKHPSVQLNLPPGIAGNEKALPRPVPVPSESRPLQTCEERTGHGSYPPRLHPTC